MLPEGPYAVLGSLPDDLKAAIKQALLDMPTKDKAAFNGLSDGKDTEFVPTKPEEYQGIIEMIRFNDDLRKRS